MNNPIINKGSLLQSKKILSGEISKEPFLDILLTNLEQSSFSLIKIKQNLNFVGVKFLKHKQSLCNVGAFNFFDRVEENQIKVKVSSKLDLYKNKSYYKSKKENRARDKQASIMKLSKSLLKDGFKENFFDSLLCAANEKSLKSVNKKGQIRQISTQKIDTQILCQVKIGDYVHCGDKIGYLARTPIVISESGKILKISQTQITIQKMQPVLFYSQAEIHVENNEWVKRGTPILTLAHQTLVTGDIVQGIPRIEQLFEASTSYKSSSKELTSIESKKPTFVSAPVPFSTPSLQTSPLESFTETSFQSSDLAKKNREHRGIFEKDLLNKANMNGKLTSIKMEKKPSLFFKTLQSQVREIFRKKWNQFPLPVAVRQSLEEIQQIIVESIQKVYLSQGVLIADKHIEIIVRQMTSKAQIFDGGSTGLLIDEILSLQQIENANISTPGQKALYIPVVMGLTQAALSSDSFVSAASFQETTRVLSRDAVAGKSDFLRGLKEKVIIGDLIDAGTGLDLFYIYSLFSKIFFENKVKDILNRKVTHKTLKKLVLTISKI